MFDRISRRYDLLNHLLSFCLDFYWRRKLIGRLPRKPGLKVLDLATGTGDVALAISRKRAESHVVGVDKSEKMLHLARRKRDAQVAGGALTLAHGDGLAIPLKSETLDAVTIAFGIRNMPDTGVCLREMHRLLQRDGKALILEFSLPRNPIFRKLHLFYLRWVVPFLGRLISGDRYAYRYLNQTVETYLQGEDFCRLMRESGFTSVEAMPLSLGIVTIYEGTKA